MAKRITDYSNSELEKLVDEDIKEGRVYHFENVNSAVDFLENPPAKIKLRLAKNLRLEIVGKVTGYRYIFPKAGAVLDVDERDAQYFLAKSTRISCCGSVGSPYFEIVSEV